MGLVQPAIPVPGVNQLASSPSRIQCELCAPAMAWLGTVDFALRFSQPFVVSMLCTLHHCRDYFWQLLAGEPGAELCDFKVCRCYEMYVKQDQIVFRASAADLPNTTTLFQTTQMALYSRAVIFRYVLT